MKHPFLFAVLFLISLGAGAAAPEGGWSGAEEMEKFIATMHSRHDFDEASLRDIFLDFEPDPLVLKAIQPPSHVGQKSWQRYRKNFLTARRIRGGQAFWEEHSAALERAENEFGVPAEIIVGIIGVETEYGRNTGRFSAVRALATLGFAYPPRAEYFRSELEQLLLLSRENGLDPRQVRGSYAGAIGIPQFMPGSQRRFGVDFNGDDRVDLCGSVDDAIGSVAAFLARHGWVTGAPVARRAVFRQAPPEDWISAGIRPSLTPEEAALADPTLAGTPAGEKLALIDLVTPKAKTEYWWGYENFYVITRYNRSSFYAMSVFQLAQAVASARRHQHGLPAASYSRLSRDTPRRRMMRRSCCKASS